MIDPGQLAFTSARIALANEAVDCIVRKSIELEDHKAIGLGICEIGCQPKQEDERQQQLLESKAQTKRPPRETHAGN